MRGRGARARACGHPTAPQNCQSWSRACRRHPAGWRAAGLAPRPLDGHPAGRNAEVALSGPVTKGCTAGRRWGPAAPAPGVSVAPGCSPGRLPFWLRAGKILAPKRSPACGFRDILGMLKADTEHADGRQHRRKAPGAAGFLAQGVFHGHATVVPAGRVQTGWKTRVSVPEG